MSLRKLETLMNVDGSVVFLPSMLLACWSFETSCATSLGDAVVLQSVAGESLIADPILRVRSPVWSFRSAVTEMVERKRRRSPS